MQLLAKAIGTILAKKALKSVTSWIGAAGVAAGVGTAIDPDLVAMVPESARPYVVMGVGVAVILARHKTEIIALYAQLRAEVKAAVAAAEKQPPPL